MTLGFHPDAEIEFYEAIKYYESYDKGLGSDFALEVCATIQRILHYPLAWPIIKDDIRRCLTNRFPYGVLYTVAAEKIYILAVMHLHRAPGYWKERGA